MNAYLVIPIKTVSGMNAREHWAARAKRVKAEREVVAFWFHKYVGRNADLLVPGTVTLVRRGPRRLDSDNAVSALKGVRDELARLLGTHDGPGGPIRWEYGPQVIGPHAVLVALESA